MGLGFSFCRETVNALEARISSRTGHVYANVRQPLIHTLNLAHLMPLSAVWAGPAQNAHLSGPPLLYAQTTGSTPFRLSTHIGDVGHRSEEHTSELQSLMRISYAVFCLKKKNQHHIPSIPINIRSI